MPDLSDYTTFELELEVARRRFPQGLPESLIAAMQSQPGMPNHSNFTNSLLTAPNNSALQSSQP